MQTKQIQAARRNGNLFIKLSGDFDPAIARSTVSAINNAYQGSGNVFINTQKIGAVLATGIATFKQDMQDSVVHSSNLFMIGAKGVHLAPTGGQVIVPPEKKGKCRGCGKCNCGKKKN